MKRLAALFCACLLAPALYAAEHKAANEHPGQAAAEHGTAGHGNPNEIWWKWANFALLAGALGYVIGKNAGGFFLGRTAQIRKGIAEAEAARAAADARMREIEARLENLSGEIAALKQSAGSESHAAAERARAQSAAEIAKIQAHAQNEIASAGKAARLELRRYTAALAVQLAESKLQARMSPEAQDQLVRRFAQRLPERPV
jgi:F-type H+-transporting ATPase subunit b